MKVCFISFEYPPKILGGAGPYANLLVEGLKNRSIDVHTITTGNETVLDQKIYRIPTPVVTYWGRPLFMMPAIRLLHDLNRLWKFDLVHFNEPHLITGNPNLPTVCTFHSTRFNEALLRFRETENLKTWSSITDLVFKSPVGSFFDITTARISNKIICPCSNLAKQIQSYCLVDEQKIHVVPNGIDPKVFDEINCDTTILDEYNIEKENFLLYIGRLSSLKGVQFVIRAFKSIKKEHTSLKLVIAGSGSFEPYLREVASSIKDIIFVGFVDNLKVKKVLYENCLAVVVPSLYETFPMVVLEAMTCSKPVIASNVGGILSMIKHGRNGFLVKPKDVGGLVIFINRLYEDPNLRRKMGMLGRKIVEKEFTIDKMVAETLKVYESLLKSEHFDSACMI